MPIASRISQEAPPLEERIAYPSLKIGMEFESLTAGADAVYDAIIQARQSFKVLTGNEIYWHAECRQRANRACPFKVIAQYLYTYNADSSIGSYCLY